MARMKFLCDAERCIECNGCVTACKQEHEIPWGVNRRRVVTLNDGLPGEKDTAPHALPDAPAWRYALSIASTKRPKASCCTTRIVHWLRLLLHACPFGAPQFRRTAHRPSRQDGQPGTSGGRPPRRITAPPSAGRMGATVSRGKLPEGAEMCRPRRCSAGRRRVVADIYRTRVLPAQRQRSRVGDGYGKPRRNGRSSSPGPNHGNGLDPLAFAWRWRWWRWRLRRENHGHRIHNKQYQQPTTALQSAPSKTIKSSGKRDQGA